MRTDVCGLLPAASAASEKICGLLVPPASLFYIGACIFVIAVNSGDLKDGLAEMFRMAFSAPRSFRRYWRRGDSLHVFGDEMGHCPRCIFQ